MQKTHKYEALAVHQIRGSILGNGHFRGLYAMTDIYSLQDP